MPENRRKRIRDLLAEKPFVSLSELENMFPDVTSMTLRRDINLLEEKGELIKVRGGAKSMKFIKTSMEDEFGKRLFENPEGKSKIAEAVQSLPPKAVRFFLIPVRRRCGLRRFCPTCRSPSPRQVRT